MPGPTEELIVRDDIQTIVTGNAAPVIESRADMRHSEGIQAFVSKKRRGAACARNATTGAPTVRGEIFSIR
jgi:hypothetical protein